MATIGSLVVEFRAETAAFKQELERVRKDTKRSADAMSSLAKTAKTAIGSFAGFVSATSLIRAFVTTVTESEQSTAKLQAVLKATGFSARLTASDIGALADELEGTSLFDDSEIKNAAAILATFRNVQGETFREGIRLAADMATVMGTDLSGATTQLGKALNSPVEGINALRRAGVSFSATQKVIIADMVRAGNIAGAQKLILQELATEFGGAAGSQHTGLSGDLHDLKNAWEDFLKSTHQQPGAGFMGLNSLGGFARNTVREAKALLDLLTPDAPVESALQQRMKLFAMRGMHTPAAPAEDPDAEKRREEAIAAAKRQREEVQRLVEGMEREAATLGMSATQLKLYELASLGATSAMQARAKAAASILDFAEGEQFMLDRMRVAADRDAARGFDAQQQAAAEYARFVRSSEADTQDFARQMTMETAAGYVDVWRESAQIVSGELSDAFASIGDEGANVFAGLARAFRRMIADMAAADLTRTIFGARDPGSGRPIGGVLGGLFGGASGGLPPAPDLGSPVFGAGRGMPTGAVVGGGAPGANVTVVNFRYSPQLNAIDTQSGAEFLERHGHIVAGQTVKAIKGSRALQNDLLGRR